MDHVGPHHQENGQGFNFDYNTYILCNIHNSYKCSGKPRYTWVALVDLGRYNGLTSLDTYATARERLWDRLDLAGRYSMIMRQRHGNMMS